jgi:chromosome segregation ATPase
MITNELGEVTPKMGLYLNTNEQPQVFRNKEVIKEPNQDEFKLDYFSELAKNQKKVNASIISSIDQLKLQNQQQEEKHIAQWGDISEQFNELKKNHDNQETFQRQAIEWLKILERNQTKLYSFWENGESLKKDLLNELNSLSESNQEIVNRLEKHESFNEIISKKMTEQKAQQLHLDERMQSHEALLDKALRQIQNLRSIVYERTTDLAEKIEKSYKLTTVYVHELFTNSKPLVLKNMKEESEKK